MSNSRIADRAHWAAIATEAASIAAAFIAEHADKRETLLWESKSPTDFVSLVDIGAEQRIVDCFRKRLPELAVIGEELGPNGDIQNGLVAVVDPLDGTTNFLHGYPAYCVSICVAVDGVAQAACVHDVARGGVYTGTLGGGAFVDGVPLKVSNIAEAARALIGTGFPFKNVAHIPDFQRQSRNLMPITSGLRRAGAAALDLADVARGRFDAFWELELMPWDMAASTLLIREAGGRVTDVEGNESGIQRGPIVASNTLMHEWLLEQLHAT
ncbi:MAG: inositol monophosphatase [Phycisphaerae bacterium]|nr:inositol monophosphatase [Gemmatimonadaceae bacterium]